MDFAFFQIEQMICEVEHSWQINAVFYMVGSKHFMYLDC